MPVGTRDSDGKLIVDEDVIDAIVGERLRARDHRFEGRIVGELSMLSFIITIDGSL